MAEDKAAPLLIVTPEQFKDGWIEMRGVTPIHHNFIAVRRLPNGNMVVRAPEAIMEAKYGQTPGTE